MAGELTGIYQDLDEATRYHIAAVRLFTRDYAELNLLIDGEESTDRMIAFATFDFLSDFNGTPPFHSFRLRDLYDINQQSLAIRGTVISLFQSLMIIYHRNNLSFSDGGLSVSINDKAPMLQNMMQLFQAQYEQNKRQIKTALNVMGLLDQGPSGVHSDYYALSALGMY